MNITREQYEADIRKAKAGAHLEVAERCRREATEIQELPRYGDRTGLHPVVGALLDLADQLDPR